MMTRKRNTASVWLWNVSGRKKNPIFFLLLAQMLLSVCSVGTAWVLRGIIDRAVAGDRQGFVRYALTLAGIVIGQLFLRALIRFLEEFSKSGLENCFKERLFETLLTREFASVTAVHSGEWMNRLTSDTVVVAEGMTSILPGVAGMLVKLTGALGVIVFLLPRVAAILVVGGIFLIILTYSFRKVLKRLHKELQEADGKVRIFLQERLNSLMIVRSFVQEEQTISQAGEKMEEHKRVRMRKNHFSNICNLGFGAVMRGAYVLGAIYCAYGILTGTMSYGTFTAVLQLIGQVQSPFANITGYLPKYYSMLASAERLMEAEAFESDCWEKALDDEEISDFYREDFQAIALAHADFTYLPPVRTERIISKEHMPVVIRDVNLEIHQGEYIALTGQSGCGKSTLLKLLMCLYPLDAGERYFIRKDGERIPLSNSCRRLFAYVPQGNQLMSGSIREVVTFADRDAMQQEEKIWRALAIACAEEFVRSLKDGLDTRLGERGLGLSEGQMQRIAIARAVFSNHPILMLDESTSALDEHTEKQVLKNLKAMTNKTVIIVTHRPAVLSICNRQVVMEETGLRELRKS